MKNKNIPELRFPEFEGEWKKTTLSKVSKYTNGKAHEKFISKKGRYIVVNSKFISTEGNEYKLSNEAFCLAKKGDVLIVLSDVPNGRAIAKCFLVLEDNRYTVNQRVAKITPKNINSPFLFYVLNRNKYFLSFDDGVKQTNLRKDDVEDFSFSSPILSEQQKIASFLTSLDNIITSEIEKLEQLKEHKQGLLQKLFPAEGKKIPEYRFEEFRNDGEWKEKKLGEVIDIKGRIGYRGYTRNDIVEQGEGAISMSPSNIDDSWNLNFSNSTYIKWEKYDESPEIMLEKGFSVLVKTGSSYGKVAYINNLIDKTTINPQLVVLKPIEIDSYFLYLLMTAFSIQSQIHQTVVGGAIPTLSQESISNFKIFVPLITEQQKIASVLSSLDSMISNLEEKLIQLENHKKGLLQRVFPKIE